MNQVTITPPYKTENIKGDCHSKAYKHIRKVVEKHLKDMQLMNSKQECENKLTGVSSTAGAMAHSQ